MKIGEFRISPSSISFYYPDGNESIHIGIYEHLLKIRFKSKKEREDNLLKLDNEVTFDSNIDIIKTIKGFKNENYE